LVSSSEYITLLAIAENLFVSQATIIHDLDEIKHFVKKKTSKFSPILIRGFGQKGWKAINAYF